MITAEELRRVLNYDPETGQFYRQTTMSLKRVGTVNAAGYIIFSLNGVLQYAHRLAWLFMTGAWPQVTIDHIDGDPSNNRFSNLREATSSQNAMNSKLSKVNTSGIKGVTWCAETSKWRAQIKINGINIALGRFENLNLAAAARKTAQDNLHGEFGRTA